MAMKWIQVDSDTIYDPKIQDVLLKFGNAGFGAVVRLWLVVSRQGKGKPGVSVDSNGNPLPKPQLVAAVGATEPEFDAILETLCVNHHINADKWRQEGIVEIPAMARRADTYTKRSNHLRTVFDDFSVQTNSTNSTNSTNKQRAHAREGSLRSPVSPKPRTGSHCAHDPRCPTFKACIARTIAEARRAKKRQG